MSDRTPVQRDPSSGLRTASTPRVRTAHGVDIARLAVAVQLSRRSLQGYLESRYFAVSQFAGPMWGGQDTMDDLKQPANMLSLFVRSLTRKLIARSPKVMLSTFQAEARASVAKMAAWTNKKIEAQGLVNTFQRAVMDAILSLGVVKVALADPGVAAATGWGTVAGEPFAKTVSLDDFVADRGAHDWSEVSFIGHKYRLPLKVAKELTIFDPKVRKDLKAVYKRITTELGTQRTDSLGPGSMGLQQEYLDYCEVWEIYLPLDRLVLTLVADDAGLPFGAKDPLRVQRWIGPDHGPYHMCFFDVVPDNLMPKAPATDVLDGNWAVNECYRKIFNQASRMKEVTFVTGKADADGKRVIESSDGDVIRVDDADSLRTVTMGGANQNLVAAATHFKDLVSYMAGGLDIWSGLGHSAPTATQDKLLSENASQMISDMQGATVGFVRSVLRGACWYWWHDPKLVMRYAEQLPKLPGEYHVREVTPKDRAKVAWDDLEFSVNPYSLQPITPQAQAAALTQIVTQELIPMMPLLQQQGVTFDVEKYLAKRAEYLDLPELTEIVSIGEPPAPGMQQDQGGGEPEAPGKPPVTTRNYNRYGTGGNTPGGRANASLALFKPSTNGKPPDTGAA